MPNVLYSVSVVVSGRERELSYDRAWFEIIHSASRLFLMAAPGGGDHNGDGCPYHNDAITHCYPDISGKKDNILILQVSIFLATNEASRGKGKQIYTFEVCIFENTE